MIDWMKATPWIIAGVMALSAAVSGRAYLGERDEFTTYRATVETLGKKAEEYKKRIETQYADNLEKVKVYEKSIATLRSNSSVNYGVRFDSGVGSVPSPANGIKLDDGTSQKSMADSFAKDCGEDAAKLEAWREWGRLNVVPVE